MSFIERLVNFKVENRGGEGLSYQLSLKSSREGALLQVYENENIFNSELGSEHSVTFRVPVSISNNEPIGLDVYVCQTQRKGWSSEYGDAALRIQHVSNGASSFTIKITPNLWFPGDCADIKIEQM